MNPRTRIRTKMSRIRNTAIEDICITIIILIWVTFVVFLLDKETITTVTYAKKHPKKNLHLQASPRFHQLIHIQSQMMLILDYFSKVQPLYCTSCKGICFPGFTCETITPISVHNWLENGGGGGIMCMRSDSILFDIFFSLQSSLL